MLRLIAAGKGKHNMKSINELFIDRNNQSSLNRFITESKWDIQAGSQGGQRPAPTGDVSIMVDVRAGTRDVHLLCTDMVGCGVGELLGHALKRHRIEDYFKGASLLVLGV